MKDSIKILGIRGFGFHGVLAEERATGQEFIVDVILDLDLARAGETDDLTATVHYGEVANLIHAEIVGLPVKLIETLAERIAQNILATFPIDRVEVTVHKPQAPIKVLFADVSVTILRLKKS